VVCWYGDWEGRTMAIRQRADVCSGVGCGGSWSRGAVPAPDRHLTLLPTSPGSRARSLATSLFDSSASMSSPRRRKPARVLPRDSHLSRDHSAGARSASWASRARVATACASGSTASRSSWMANRFARCALRYHCYLPALPTAACSKARGSPHGRRWPTHRRGQAVGWEEGQTLRAGWGPGAALSASLCNGRWRG